MNRLTTVANCLKVVGILVTGAALCGCDHGLNSTDLVTQSAGTGSSASSGTTQPGAPGGHALTLSWDAPMQNSDGSTLADLRGYKIYYGDKSGDYSTVIEVANPGLTTYVVQNLPSGTYYFALTDYNSQGMESSLTSEVSVAVD